MDAVKLFRGRLALRGKYWYWEYYDRIRKHSYCRSTKETSKSIALRKANRWIEEYLQAWGEGVKKKSSKNIVLFKALFDEYFIAQKNYVTVGWWKNIFYLYASHLAPFFDDIPVTEIRPKLISRFQSKLLEEGLAPQTVNKITSTLSKSLKFAAAHEYIESVPFVPRLPVQQQEYGYALNDEEVQRLLYGAKEAPEHLRTVIYLSLFCGLRKGEAFSLRWENIDWDRGIIRLDAQKNRKGSKAPAPLGLARGPLSRMERHGEHVVMYFDEKSFFWRPVKTVQGSWNTFRKLHGFEHVRMHDLRHTHATRAVNLFGVEGRGFTRHSSMTALANYYHSRLIDIIARADELWTDNIKELV